MKKLSLIVLAFIVIISLSSCKIFKGCGCPKAKTSSIIDKSKKHA